MALSDGVACIELAHVVDESERDDGLAVADFMSDNAAPGAVGEAVCPLGPARHPQVEWLNHLLFDFGLNKVERSKLALQHPMNSVPLAWP